jgi:hypothetical protein
VKWLLWAMAMVLAGCAARRSPALGPATIAMKTEPASSPPAEAAPPHEDPHDFIDLQPGWRLRVTAAITKSGRMPVPATSGKLSGGTMTLSVSTDFEGYETSYYSVETQERGGVAIRFVSAELVAAGKSIPEPEPRLHIFRLPPDTRVVRLAYFTRLSNADHDMAIISGPDEASVVKLSRKIHASGGCADSERASCSWVPPGVAVVPENWTDENGAGHWAPVR